MKIKLLAGFAALGAAAVLVVAAQAPAAKSGWWLRIDTQKTEADAIGLQLGSSAQDRRTFKTWRRGEPAEFDLPGDGPVLHLHATAVPDDEDVWFCVYYQTHGVRRFDFDTVEAANMKSTDRDRACR